MLPFLSCSGCRKDEPSGDSELILGTWTILPTTYALYTGGSLAGTSTEKYNPGDYGVFNKSQSYQVLANGTLRNGTYKVEGDSLVFDQASKAKIKTLTLNNFSYYFTTNINATQYRVSTFSYNR